MSLSPECPFKAGDTVAWVSGYGSMGNVRLVKVEKITPGGQVVVEGGKRFRRRGSTWDLIVGRSPSGYYNRNAIEAVTDEHRARLLASDVGYQFARTDRAGLSRLTLGELQAIKDVLDTAEARLSREVSK